MSINRLGYILKIQKKMETVVIRTTQKDQDSDRIALLEQVIEEAGFWNILDEQFIKSGKTKNDFLIAVKPNLIMYYKKHDMSIITEPALVEQLINKIAEKGYTNIALVESQNGISKKSPQPLCTTILDTICYY